MAKKKGDWLPYFEDRKIKGCRIPKAMILLPFAIILNYLGMAYKSTKKIRNKGGKNIFLIVSIFLFIGAVSSQSVLEDFEDGGITEYTGDTSGFDVNQNNPVYNGNYSLKGTSGTSDIQATSSNLGINYSQGDSLQVYWQFTQKTTDDRDNFCIFAKGQGANAGIPDNGYCMTFQDAPSKGRDNKFGMVERHQGGTENRYLTSYDWKTSTWYRGNITYANDGNVDVELYNTSSGNKVASKYDITPVNDLSSNDNIAFTIQGTSFAGTHAFDYAVKNNISNLNSDPSLSNPSPSDGASSVSTNKNLSIKYSDPDNDKGRVEFYNKTDNSLIDNITNISSGSTAETSNLALNNDQTVEWYAKAYDREGGSTRSSNFSFTTKINIPDEVIDNFEDGDITEYTGDTGSFSVDKTNPVYNGSYSLKTSSTTSDILASTSDLNQNISVGESVQVFWRHTADSNDDRDNFCIFAKGQGANGGIPDNGYCLGFWDRTGDENIFRLYERNSGSRVNKWNVNQTWQTDKWYMGNITYAKDGNLDAEVYAASDLTTPLATIYNKSPSNNLSGNTGISFGIQGTSISGTHIFDYVKNGTGNGFDAPNVTLESPVDKATVNGSAYFNYTPECYSNSCSNAELFLNFTKINLTDTPYTLNTENPVFEASDYSSNDAPDNFNILNYPSNKSPVKVNGSYWAVFNDVGSPDRALLAKSDNLSSSQDWSVPSNINPAWSTGDNGTWDSQGIRVGSFAYIENSSNPFYLNIVGANSNGDYSVGLTCGDKLKEFNESCSTNPIAPVSWSDGSGGVEDWDLIKKENGDWGAVYEDNGDTSGVAVGYASSSNSLPNSGWSNQGDLFNSFDCGGSFAANPTIYHNGTKYFSVYECVANDGSGTNSLKTKDSFGSGSWSFEGDVNTGDNESWAGGYVRANDVISLDDEFQVYYTGSQTSTKKIGYVKSGGTVFEGVKKNQSKLVNASENSIFYNFTSKDYNLSQVFDWNIELSQSDGQKEKAKNNNTLTVKSVNSIDSTAPSITINAPTNQTYNSSSVDLNVTTDEPVNFTYNVDGGSNTSATEDDTDLNTSLTGLGDGSHTVNVYGTDAAGNTGSASETFTVNTADSTPPKYRNFQDNVSSNVSLGQEANISLEIYEQGSGLDEIWVEANQSGRTLNYTLYESGDSAGQENGRFYDDFESGNADSYWESDNGDTLSVVANSSLTGSYAWNVTASTNTKEYTPTGDYYNSHSFEVYPVSGQPEIGFGSSDLTLTEGNLYFDSATQTIQWYNQTDTIDLTGFNYGEKITVDTRFYHTKEQVNINITFSNGTTESFTKGYDKANPLDFPGRVTFTGSNSAEYLVDEVKFENEGYGNLWDFTAETTYNYSLFDLTYQSDLFSGRLEYKVWMQDAQGNKNKTGAKEFVVGDKPDVDQAEVKWENIGGSTTQDVILGYSDEDSISNVASPPSGSLSSHDTEATVTGWNSPFNWRADVDDSFSFTGSRDVNFTANDQGLSERPGFSQSLDTQRFQQTVNLSVSGDPVNVSISFYDRGTVIQSGTKTVDGVSSSVSSTEVWEVDNITDEKNYDAKPATQNIQLGTNFTATRQFETNNSRSFKFTDVDTGGKVRVNGNCTGTNTSTIDVASGVSNTTLGLDCSSGSKTLNTPVDKTSNADADNDTHYYLNGTMNIDTNISEKSNVYFDVQKNDQNLNDWADRDTTTVELYIDGQAKNNLTVQDLSGKVRLNFTDDCCSSSPSKGSHNFSLFYEVDSGDTTIIQSGGGGGGSSGSQERSVYINDPNKVRERLNPRFGTEDVVDLEVVNTVRQDVTVTFDVGDDGICKYMQVETGVGTGEFGDQGRYEIGAATNTLGTVENSTSVGVRFDLPSKEALENSSIGDLSCEVGTAPSTGVSEELVVAVDDKPSLLQQFINFLNDELGFADTLFEIPVADSFSLGTEPEVESTYDVTLGNVVGVFSGLGLIGFFYVRRDAFL